MSKLLGTNAISPTAIYVASCGDGAVNSVGICGVTKCLVVSCFVICPTLRDDLTGIEFD